MFIEIEGQLINLATVRRVTYDEGRDHTAVVYDIDDSMESFKGDLRVAILAAAGGRSVEGAA